MNDQIIRSTEMARNGIEYFKCDHAGLFGMNRILDNESTTELFGKNRMGFTDEQFYPWALPVARATGIRVREQEDVAKIWLPA